ncbi:hypothetical protein ABTZ57_34605 [Streptomyces sp. NPDC094048]|uniref:hypothetical protein n=1 Tax=Streptomyces sp. NPDC094048 TaxID=3155207 RepID=UPI00332DCA2B
MKPGRRTHVLDVVPSATTPLAPQRIAEDHLRLRGTAVSRMGRLDRVMRLPKPPRYLDTPRAAEARRAASTWTAYHAFADRYPPALPFHHFAERARTLEPEHAREAAVATFREQPLIQAIEADPALEERFTSDPALRLDEDLETYVTRHVAAVLPTLALLTLDRRWVEGGGPDCERMFNACLDGLPGDTMVVRVLYHS